MQNLPGSNVLNLGSGSGRDAILLRDAGCDVLCIDGSQAMVERTIKLGFTSKRVMFDDLDLEGTLFDGVWAYTSLLHVPKNEVVTVLNKLTTAITTNGCFC